MQIPGFIRGKAKQGNKVAQAFVQQYDNGDNTPYDPEAYAALKAQMGDNQLEDTEYEADAPREEDFTPEEKKANDRIQELDKKYRASTLDGETFDEEIEANSEEEAFAKAEELHPGFGDELSVDEIKNDNNDLYEELADNEYYYGHLNKEQASEVMQERTGKSKEEVDAFLDKHFNEHFWDVDSIGENDIPSEKEIDSLRKQEERAKLDKQYPDRGDPEVSKEINKAMEEKPEYKGLDLDDYLNDKIDPEELKEAMEYNKKVADFYDNKKNSNKEQNSNEPAEADYMKNSGYKNRTRMSEEDFKKTYRPYEKGKGGYEFWMSGDNKGYTLFDKSGKTVGHYDLGDNVFYHSGEDYGEGFDGEEKYSNDEDFSEFEKWPLLTNMKKDIKDGKISKEKLLKWLNL